MKNDEDDETIRGLSTEHLYEMLARAQESATALEPIKWQSEEAAHAAGRAVYLYGLLAKEAARRVGDEIDDLVIGGLGDGA